MAVIDATPGGANANSFATIAEADLYWDGQLYDVWTASSTATKTKALITATRLLVKELSRRLVGYAVSSTQALPFPRAGLLSATGYAISSAVIPREFVAATAELAGRLIDAGQMPDTPADSAGIKSVKAGPVSIEFEPSSGIESEIPDAVFAMIAFLVVGGSRNGICVPLVRV